MNDTAFTEGDLTVELQCDAWVKWDAALAYVHGIGRLAHTKAVDACIVCNSQVIYLEIKDFRHRRQDLSRRIASGELAREVAEKVRDTLAGLIWACQRELVTPDFTRIVRAFVAADRPRVVLWLEDDRATPAIATALTNAIQSHLKPWIAAKVIVTSRALERQTKYPIDGIRIAPTKGKTAARRRG